MSTTAQSHNHGPSGPTEEELARSVAIGHEQSDAQTRPLLYGAISLVVLLVVSFAVIAGLLLVAGSQGTDMSNQLGEAEVQELQLPPEPRLEQDPTVDGARIENAAIEQLESYGWVDQRGGLAHIPIERAKQLILERGVGPIE